MEITGGEQEKGKVNAQDRDNAVRNVGVCAIKRNVQGDEKREKKTSRRRLEDGSKTANADGKGGTTKALQNAC